MKDLFKLLDKSFSFQEKPFALPSDHRPLWRISLLLLIIKICSRGSKISLKKLHMVNWIISASERITLIIDCIKLKLPPAGITVRFDPALGRAIEFAVSEELVQRLDGSRISLTNKGDSFIKEIIAADCFDHEKDILAEIKPILTEKIVEQILRWEIS